MPANKKGNSVSETQWGVHTAASGTKVIMDAVGDEFIGTFTGIQHIVPENSDKEEFDQVGFTGTNGEPYTFPASYKLIRAFKTIDVGTMCRLTLKGLVPIPGQPSPMKDIQIDTAK
jgi:hypothetical protein